MEKGRTPTWKWCSVRSVADVNPETPLPHGAMSVPYYGMAAIDESTGELREPDMVGLDGALRGKSKFQNGDVLFARISPCVQNRKSALAQGIPGNFALGSSEFYVLRPKRSISAEYLFYFLRQQEIVDSAVANLTGTSGRQRVPGSFWDTVTIPVPRFPCSRESCRFYGRPTRYIENAARHGRRWKQFVARYLSKCSATPVRTLKVGA